MQRPKNERQRCAQFMTDIGKKLRLKIVQFVKPLVKTLQFLGSQVNFRFRFFHAQLQLFGELFIFGSALLESNKLRYIFDTMNDIEDLSVGSENRRIGGTPEALFKAAPF